MKTVNLKSDMPQVHEALQRLDRELAVARQEKAKLLKLVHGYGSTGAGGDIRIAAQKRLLEMVQNGQLRGCIFGEDWSKSDEAAWKLLQSHPELKGDSDLGRRNRGITIVVFWRMPAFIPKTPASPAAQSGSQALPPAQLPPARLRSQP